MVAENQPMLKDNGVQGCEDRSSKDPGKDLHSKPTGIQQFPAVGNPNLLSGSSSVSPSRQEVEVEDPVEKLQGLLAQELAVN